MVAGCKCWFSISVLNYRLPYNSEIIAIIRGNLFQAYPSVRKNYLHEFTHYRFTRVGPTSNNGFVQSPFTKNRKEKRS